jgi:hypothetical protein
MGPAPWPRTLPPPSVPTQHGNVGAAGAATKDRQDSCYPQMTQMTQMDRSETPSSFVVCGCRSLISQNDPTEDHPPFIICCICVICG